ncbi:MAG: GlsB/YeaQ/YmgE family stress response membrane protein [Steroidobacteraceae bacterium]
MNLIILLVVGGVVGWLASLIMKTDAQQGLLLNVVVGIVGAVLAGFVVTPLIGGASIMSGTISVTTIIVSLLGAIVLLAIVNLIRRGRAR